MKASAPIGTQLNHQQRIDWLRLIRSENVGPQTFRLLTNRFGGAREALARLPELARHGGAKRPIRPCPEARATQEYERIRQAGCRLVAPGEPGYPPLFQHLTAPPPLVTFRGEPAVSLRPAVAVVGTRNPSVGGRRLCETLTRELGEAGFVIVSGFARGIDTCAHRAAMPTGTLAVFAGGMDCIYPPENASLGSEIVDSGGGLLTEMPWGWRPRGQDFPRRNRLVSGASWGVVVIEASRRSGSLITARLAGEQGRLLFAVPGSPLDPRSEGTNRLIREGATLVTTAAQVCEAIEPLLDRRADRPDSVGQTLFEAESSDPDQGPPEPGAGVREIIANALGVAPISIDELIRETGLSVADTQLVLLELELAGRLEWHGAQRLSLLPAAA